MAAADVAHDLWTQGQDRYRLYTPRDNAAARVLLKAAIVVDPTSVRAHALLAATYRQDATLLWTADLAPVEAQALALGLAKHAVALSERDPDSRPYALEQLGFVLLYQRDHAGCIRAALEARDLSPAADQPRARARALALWAHALTYQEESGDFKTREALKYLEEAEALYNPLPDPLPFTIRYNKGHALAVQAYYVEREGNRAAAQPIYAEAEAELWQVLDKAQTYRPARTYLVVVLWAQEKVADARAQTQHLAAEGRLSPHDAEFPAYIHRAHPFTDEAYLAHLIAAWQAAAP